MLNVGRLNDAHTILDLMNSIVADQPIAGITAVCTPDRAGCVSVYVEAVRMVKIGEDKFNTHHLLVPIRSPGVRGIAKDAPSEHLAEVARGETATLAQVIQGLNAVPGSECARLLAEFDPEGAWKNG